MPIPIEVIENLLSDLLAQSITYGKSQRDSSDKGITESRSVGVVARVDITLLAAMSMTFGVV